jgi:pimeloyl-ACP methyl ester carboxylesterase
MVPFRKMYFSLWTSTTFVGAMFLLNGAVLFVAERMIPGKKGLGRMQITDALLIGICQAVAVIPGLSRLALTVTCAEQNPVLRESIREWVDLAKAGDHAGFMDSNLRRIYSERYYRQNKWMTPLIGALTKPKSYDRFFIQAEACLTHDARAELGKIQAQTLVIGGEKDLALGGEASRVLAAHIPGAELKMYAEWGHGLYEEAGDFNDVVLAFLDA